MLGKKAGGKKNREFDTPYSLKNALAKGNIITRLSVLIMGLGNIANRQIVKGLMFLALEVAYIYFMINTGFNCLVNFVKLGGRETEEIWNESKGVYEYIIGDKSILFLLYGVAVVFLTILFIVVWKTSVSSAYKAQCLRAEGKKPATIIEDIKNLFDKNLHGFLLFLPITGIVLFTILPLVYMICMAFTDYSIVNDRLNIFNWVGLVNFGKVLNLKNTIGQEFWPVLGWTLCWAVLATFSNYILGMILAIIINRKNTKVKGLWRFCFMMSAAIPQFVSLLLMRTLFSNNGIVNTMLINAGIIENFIPFWDSVTWARVLVVVINIWVGVPFTMLQVTGVLQNIPTELYEAARVDGAGPVTIFFKITLPYMLFVTSPYLITSFTGNINNFNVIFLLSGGNPAQSVGSTSGQTDLLVTWLYKLTISKNYYNIGAVIGILTFVVLAVVSLITYHRTSSYKNEEGFQ